ncbi:MAG: DUF3089 domain-containing protein, partial [Bacteroidota bacterium]
TILFLLIFNIINAQTNYNQLTNWYYHPDKLVNFIENYNLDIAVVNKKLGIDSIIQNPNNAAKNTGIDIFWVHPTNLDNPPIVPQTIPIAEQNITHIGLTILAQGALLAKYGRFFAPKYRQATPASFLGSNFTEQERAVALLDTYSDIKAAFLHYLDNHNNGNKIILAGHSQGSFLLGMLLRDVFDNDPQLRSKLVVASLAGMGYIYAQPGTFKGGWWENIPLCTSMQECGCVQYWRSYTEDFDLPTPRSTFPSFNQVLVDGGYVYRATNIEEDLFVQDSLFYGVTISPLRYYLAPNAGYNLASDINIIAFDSMYTARFKRESNTEIGLAIEYINDPDDLRPNDLDNAGSNPFFAEGDLHIKDYHIYLWALMEQIDRKLEGCSFVNTDTILKEKEEPQFIIYPNPNNGTFNIKVNSSIAKAIDETFTIIDLLGRVVETFNINSNETEINIQTKGIYFLISKHGYQKIIVD